MLKKLRAAFIRSVTITRARFENFQYWDRECDRRREAYRENPTRENREAYIYAKRMRSIRLRTFRKSRLDRIEKRAAYLAQKKIEHAPLRIRAAEIALSFVGIMEEGGNNIGRALNELIREGGGIPGQAWCGWFCAVVYKRAGSKLVTWQWGAVRLLSSVPGVKVLRLALRGFLVRFNFDHVGIFLYYCDAAGKKVSRWKATHIKTVEGNTGATGSVSDSTDGRDGVRIKIRPLHQVQDFINIPR